jgi:GNAT superfamily N-acetyltransferase
MTIELSPVEDGDWLTIMDVNMDAFHEHEHPIIDALFPNHQTPAGRDIIAKRLQEKAKADPSGHHLKLTDTATGRIAGQGRWAIVHPEPGNEYPPPTLRGDYWANEEDLEFANWLISRYTEFRRQRFREATRPVFAITSLPVLPEYEGRGAGSISVRWGIDQADAIGSEVRIHFFQRSYILNKESINRSSKCIVESGMRAVSFYAKHGFEQREHVSWPPPKKWRQYGAQEVRIFL